MPNGTSSLDFARDLVFFCRQKRNPPAANDASVSYGQGKVLSLGQPHRRSERALASRPKEGLFKGKWHRKQCRVVPTFSSSVNHRSKAANYKSQPVALTKTEPDRRRTKDLLNSLLVGVATDEILKDCQHVPPVVDDALEHGAEVRLALTFPVPFGEHGCWDGNIPPELVRFVTSQEKPVEKGSLALRELEILQDFFDRIGLRGHIERAVYRFRRGRQESEPRNQMKQSLPVYTPLATFRKGPG